MSCIKIDDWVGELLQVGRDLTPAERPMRRLSQCPACLNINRAFSSARPEFNPSLCDNCGHFFIPTTGGRGRNLTAAEKIKLREVNANAGGIARKRQDEIVKPLFG